MTGTPRLRHSTHEKRTRRSVVGVGGTTRATQRFEISDTRRAQVYRTDPELFAAPEQRSGANPITPAELERIIYLRDVEGLAWEKIGNEVDRSGTGCMNAYKKHKKRESKSGT